MTDLRNLKNHSESEEVSGWATVGAVAICVAIIVAVWLVVPGARTVDEVFGIEPPAAVGGRR